VVLEEIAFPGILLQLLFRISKTNEAIALQSVVFVLWHVGLLLRGVRPTTLAWFSIIIFLGGALLAFLRVRTSSLAGPMVAHWLLNVLVMVALSRR
jgi:membrane protease YdiL (CAAX protease family)